MYAVVRVGSFTTSSVDQVVLGFQVHIKPGYVTYFSVEVFVPKREGQYIGEIEMETDYEVSQEEV